MKNKSVIEYSVVGQEIEEHFETYKKAESFCKDLNKNEQMKVQFFSKKWINGNEDEVIIFKNFNQQLPNEN